MLEAQIDTVERAVEPTPDEVFGRGIHREFGLTDTEYSRIVALLGRRPNFTETGIFSVMWSEHCSYKSSKPMLRMLPTSGPQVLQGPGENAGIVDIGDGLAVSFKVESHNHPSAIEPYEGAATGVGGIIRDVFTMGARPIALLNSLRFGPIDRDDADRNARNRYLFGGVVAGIAGYGNCIGIPTVGGEVVFDEAYRDNPLVNAMCIGLLRHEEIARGTASGVGNPVLAVGARTGRDGIHGATFASVEDPHSRERSAVQVGDPFTEKLLLEACLELLATGEVVGIQDMGAAGLTSSSVEMAARAGSGIDLDMLAVPRRETGMTPYELMLSESQERMLVVMQAGSEHVAREVFERWGLEAAVIGAVTDSGTLTIREGTVAVASIPIAALVDEAPETRRPARRPRYLAATGSFDPASIPGPDDLGAVLLDLLASPTIASKRWVHEQYDSMVGTATAVRPGSDAAVVLVHGTRTAIAASIDGNGRYVYLNPRRGAAHAVAEAARNVACAGARPLAITDCLNFGSPENPEVAWQMREACKGIAEACRALDTPVISGNVSLYNQTAGRDIYPTPVIGMVGLIDDIDHITTQALKAEGNLLVLAGAIDDAQLGGSEYLARVHGIVAGDAPPLDLDLEARLQRAVRAAIRAALVVSAHDVSDGGLAVCLAEAAIAGGLGVSVTLPARARADVALFGEAGARVVLEVAPDRVANLVATFEAAGVPMRTIGSVGGSVIRATCVGSVSMCAPLASAAAAWGSSLDNRMG